MEELKGIRDGSFRCPRRQHNDRIRRRPLEFGQKGLPPMTPNDNALPSLSELIRALATRLPGIQWKNGSGQLEPASNGSRSATWWI